jgi:hypothetical protein
VKLPPRQSRLAVVVLAVLADGREVLDSAIGYRSRCYASAPLIRVRRVFS